MTTRSRTKQEPPIETLERTASTNGWQKQFAEIVDRFDADLSRRIERYIEPNSLVSACDLVLNIFKVEDSRNRNAIIVMALCLDQFARIVDDQTDRFSSNDPSILHASSMLIVEAAQIGGHLTGTNPQFWTSWRDHMYEASLAERHLAANRSTPHDPSTDSLFLGRKCAYLKIIADACAAVTGRYLLLEPTYNIIENVLAAVHLMDDLEDWEEDFDAKHFSTVLCFACEDGALHKKSQVASALLSGGVAIRIVSLIRAYLNNTLTALSSIDRYDEAIVIQKSVADLGELNTYLQSIKGRPITSNAIEIITIEIKKRIPPIVSYQ